MVGKALALTDSGGGQRTLFVRQRSTVPDDFRRSAAALMENSTATSSGSRSGSIVVRHRYPDQRPTSSPSFSPGGVYGPTSWTTASGKWVHRSSPAPYQATVNDMHRRLPRVLANRVGGFRPSKATCKTSVCSSSSAPDLCPVKPNPSQRARDAEEELETRVKRIAEIFAAQRATKPAVPYMSQRIEELAKHRIVQKTSANLDFRDMQPPPEALLKKKPRAPYVPMPPQERERGRGEASQPSQTDNLDDEIDRTLKGLSAEKPTSHASAAPMQSLMKPQTPGTKKASPTSADLQRSEKVTSSTEAAAVEPTAKGKLSQSSPEAAAAKPKAKEKHAPRSPDAPAATPNAKEKQLHSSSDLPAPEKAEAKAKAKQQPKAKAKSKAKTICGSQDGAAAGNENADSAVPHEPSEPNNCHIEKTISGNVVDAGASKDGVADGRSPKSKVQHDRQVSDSAANAKNTAAAPQDAPPSNDIATAAKMEQAIASVEAKQAEEDMAEEPWEKDRISAGEAPSPPPEDDQSSKQASDAQTPTGEAIMDGVDGTSALSASRSKSAGVESDTFTSDFEKATPQSTLELTGVRAQSGDLDASEDPFERTGASGATPAADKKSEGNDGLQEPTVDIAPAAATNATNHQTGAPAGERNESSLELKETPGPDDGSSGNDNKSSSMAGTIGTVVSGSMNADVDDDDYDDDEAESDDEDAEDDDDESLTKSAGRLGENAGASDESSDDMIEIEGGGSKSTSKASGDVEKSEDDEESDETPAKTK